VRALASREVMLAFCHEQLLQSPISFALHAAPSTKHAPVLDVMRLLALDLLADTISVRGALSITPLLIVVRHSGWEAR
jgi:hypothetical protein